MTGVQPRPLRHRGRLNRRGRRAVPTFIINGRTYKGVRFDRIDAGALLALDNGGRVVQAARGWGKTATAAATAPAGRIMKINGDGSFDVMIGRGLFAVDGGKR